eukprot:1518044-Alexandrium_andersonii.AAC.1
MADSSGLPTSPPARARYRLDHREAGTSRNRSGRGLTWLGPGIVREGGHSALGTRWMPFVCAQPWSAALA